MKKKYLETPVLLLVFNRLDTTVKVFESLKKVKPKKLYVASDGSRSGEKYIPEGEKVQSVRDYITSSVDWNCELKTLFRNQNLGCKLAVSSAMNWFFSHEEMGIILEDDCLPNESFFWFCQELLIEYKNDDRVGMISGRNNLETYYPDNNSPYFFSSRGFIWGWATWKRVFDTFDVELGTPQKPVSLFKLAKASTSLVEFLYRRKNISKIRSGKVNSWGYPWNINMLLKGKLALIPSQNLVENIGFGRDATHTRKDSVDNIKICELELPCFTEQEVTSNVNFVRKSIIQEYGGYFQFFTSSFGFLEAFKRKVKILIYNVKN